MKISNYNIIKEFEDEIIVYNSYSKSSLVLEKNSNLEMFKNIEEFEKLNTDEKRILIENGFVIDDDREEIKELEYIYKQKFFETNYLCISLVPTLRCNFKCPYCFEKNNSCGNENIKNYFKTLKKYAEKHFSNHKIVQISLFGGEPLLYYDECIKFLDWLKEDSKEKKYKYFINIVTNGSLLNEEIFIRLLEHNMYSLQITIDSDKQTHDKNRIFNNNKPSFDLLINNINKLIPLSKKYEKFKFILRINLNNTSKEKVKSTLSCIDEEVRKQTYLLIRVIYNTHAYNECNSNKLDDLRQFFNLGKNMGFNILKETYKFQTCEACADRKFFYLMPDLSIWKCINDINYNRCCIGKINEEGELILKPQNIINWYNKCTEVFIDKKCIKCKMLPDCLGGCPLYRCKNGKRQCRTFDVSSLSNIYINE